MSEQSHHIAAFRAVPRAGVIYVTTEAAKLGFTARVQLGSGAA